jgi:glutamyl-tRNA reductase
MQLSVTGISHQSAPVALRERFAFSSEELPPALDVLRTRFGAAAILSTCNRTEVYLADGRNAGRDQIIAALAHAKGEPSPEAAPFYHETGIDAARRLFRVAAGIESLVVGEHEILGQVRAAFAAATTAGASNPVLARLFHSAIRAGRRARSETEIGSHGVSVSATAVALSRRTLGDLRRKSVLIVGAGEAARLAAAALAQQGAGRLLVTTRTFDRARDIAAELGGAAYPFEDLPSVLAEADIVITSTSAPTPVISRHDLERAMATRPSRPLVIVDIAVPRDVEPDAASLEGVRLFDIDDLEEAAAANRDTRALEVPAVEAIVAAELARFSTWYEGQQVEPTIAALRRRAEAIRTAELDRTLARLPGLPQTDRARIEAMTKALVKRLLHDPVTRLRAAGTGPEVASARDLFGLDQDEF